MVRYKGIKATILRYDDKQPYREYPQAQKYYGYRRRCKEVYIEAVSEERFTVVVEIMPGFDFMSSTHVKIKLSVDNRWKAHWSIAATDVTKSKSAAAIDDRQIVWDQDERLVDDKWMSCGMTFIRLQIHETDEPTDDQVAYEIDTRGCVFVKVTRGTSTDCVPFLATASEQAEVVPASSSSSKDVIKKNHISHDTKLVQLGECEPFLTDYEFEDADGAGETPIELTFRCRSQDALERLKIKPQTPSPPPYVSATSTSGKHTVPAGVQHGGEHIRVDDDEEEPRPKAIEREMGVGNQDSKSNVKRRCTSPVLKAETMNDHKDPTASTKVSDKPPIKHYKRKSASTTIKIEDDEIEIVDVRPASHAQPKQVLAQSTVAVAASQSEDPAQRFRKKAILKKWLEVLRAEQELLEMED